MKAVPLRRRTPLDPGTSRLRRTAPVPRNVPLRASAGEAGDPAPRPAKTARPHSFPPAVRVLLAARDPWCVYCGSPFGLQNHHRRLKGIGGDGRDHTQCACNGVRLCWLCHSWAHSGRGRPVAEAEGLIIPRSTLEPVTLSVLVHLKDDRRGLQLWPLCDGTWAYEPPGGLLGPSIAAITPEDAAALLSSLGAGGET